MTDQQNILKQFAFYFDQLVSCANYSESLVPILEKMYPFEGMEIIEIGAGTGILTQHFLSKAKSVIAVDASPHMLDRCRSRFESEPKGLQLLLADHTAFPLKIPKADLVILNGCLSHLLSWPSKNWEKYLGLTIERYRQNLKPQGAMVVLETLNLGTPEPKRINETAPFFELLCQNFPSPTWARIDYQFPTQKAGADLIKLFFGETQSNQFLQDNPPVFYECLGIWHSS